MFTAIIHELAKRKGLLLLGLAALGLLWYMGCAISAYQETGGVETGNDDVQYLSTYGEWIEVPPYGMVWRPDVVSSWEPFYYGHWVWTNGGWAWASYEPYGWLVYHYGSWDYQSDAGWFWVPGDTWSPAQVEWYTFGDYTAWAPLPPSNALWPDPWEPYQVNVWVVVDTDDFTNENIGGYRVDTPSREIVQRQTVNKRPPEIRRVEELSNRNVPVVKIRKQTMNIRPRTRPPQVPAQPEQARPAQPEQARPSQPEQARPAVPKLKQMLLPQVETRKVKKYEPQVEREVLAPKKVLPPPPQSPEKKSDAEPKKRIR